MPQKLVEASAKHRGGVPLERLEILLAGEDGNEAVQSPGLADLGQAPSIEADGYQRVGNTAHRLA